MKTIRCQNGFINEKNGKCGHVLAIISDAIIASLKTDPDGIILRCSRCHSDQRWIKLSDKGNGPVISIIKRPENLPENLIFTDVHVFNEVV